jgi:hypothetical protein
MRDLQALLAERRENVLEQSCETDATVRAILQFHIAELDREIEKATRQHDLAIARSAK